MPEHPKCLRSENIFSRKGSLMVALSAPTHGAAVCVNSCVLTSHRARLNVFP